MEVVKPWNYRMYIKRI